MRQEFPLTNSFISIYHYNSRGLTVELPTLPGWVRPGNQVSLRISEGESLGLVGESGSGKTMSSLALMGLLPPRAPVSGEASLATDASQPKDAYSRELLSAVPELPNA